MRTARTHNQTKKRPAPVGSTSPVPVRAPDRWLIAVTFLLVIIGVAAVFDASYVKAIESDYARNDPYFFFKRQAVFALIGTGAFLAGMHLGYWRLRPYAGVFLMGSIILLLLVLIPSVGKLVDGARRWLDLGPVRLQPSEIAKISLVIFLSSYLASNRKKLRYLQEGFIPAVLPMLLVCFLVMLEPDMGTMLATATVCVALLYAGGAERRHVWGLMGSGVAAVTLLAILEPYRLQRLLVYLNPLKDKEGAGYQIVQGLAALGTGGPLGVGVGMSRAKWHYLPAERTDFIMAIIGEELGLFGTIGILTLFFFLLRRGFLISGRCRNQFGSLLALGISIVIFVQALINIGVVSTLIPATGVPLPLVSYGGSSLVLTMFALGVLADISRRPVLPWDNNEQYDSRINRRGDRGTYISGPEYRRSPRKSRRHRSVYR